MMVRKFESMDKEVFLSLAKQFYASGSVDHEIPEQNMRDAFDAIVAGSPYVSGFLILHEGAVAGYALMNYTYSMEIGGKIAGLDELFIAKEFQGKGLGSAFLKYMKSDLADGLKGFRLEIVSEKKNLQKLYEKYGFQMMGYSQMVCQFDK